MDSRLERVQDFSMSRRALHREESESGMLAICRPASKKLSSLSPDGWIRIGNLSVSQMSFG